MTDLSATSATRATRSTQFNPVTGQPILTNTDFNKILMAQMAVPDLSALFDSGTGTESTSNNSLFGSNDSLLGSSSSLISNLMGSSSSAMSNLTSLSSTAFSISMLSNLIANTVTAIDPKTGKRVSGKVKSVIVDGLTPTLLTEDGQTIDPNNVTEVS